MRNESKSGPKSLPTNRPKSEPKNEIWNGEGVIGIGGKDYFRGDVLPIDGIERETLKELRDAGQIIPEPEPKKGKGKNES